MRFHHTTHTPRLRSWCSSSQSRHCLDGLGVDAGPRRRASWPDASVGRDVRARRDPDRRSCRPARPTAARARSGTSATAPTCPRTGSPPTSRAGCPTGRPPGQPRSPRRDPAATQRAGRPAGRALLRRRVAAVGRGSGLLRPRRHRPRSDRGTRLPDDRAAVRRHRGAGDVPRPAGRRPASSEVVLGGFDGRHEVGPGRYETLSRWVGSTAPRCCVFTSPHGIDAVEHTRPSPAYLAMLATGLQESRAAVARRTSSGRRRTSGAAVAPGRVRPRRPLAYRIRGHVRSAEGRGGDHPAAPSRTSKPAAAGRSTEELRWQSISRAPVPTKSPAGWRAPSRPRTRPGSGRRSRSRWPAAPPPRPRCG